MRSDNASLPSPEDSPDLRGRIRQRGWPLTKASYLLAMYGSDFPAITFPIDAEILAAIPWDVPGPVPQSLMDLLAVKRTRGPKKPASNTASR